MYHITIGYGLPGSGKTTYLKSKLEEKSYHDNYACKKVMVDCDKLLQKERTDSSHDIVKLLDKHFDYYLKYVASSSNRIRYMYIDGLFTTNEQLIKLIDVIKKHFNEEFDITVEWWKEDREACIWNDEYRRDKSSILSIKNLPYENLDIFKIRDKTGVNVKQNIHQVVRKSKEMHYLQDKGLSNTKILKSDYWCLGGEWRDCYGGRHPVSPDEPRDFTEFDEILEEIAPDLSFLKYKKLYKECVEKKDWYESDYYGGGVTNCHYICDLEKLVSMLFEWGLIKED